MTTQIGTAGGRSFQASVAATTTLTDTASGFTAADVGRVVATANVTAGTRISSVTDAGHAIMSAAATGTSGPQACTLTPFFANATFDASGRTLKTCPVISGAAGRAQGWGSGRATNGTTPAGRAQPGQMRPTSPGRWAWRCRKYEGGPGVA